MKHKHTDTYTQYLNAALQLFLSYLGVGYHMYKAIMLELFHNGSLQAQADL